MTAPPQKASGYARSTCCPRWSAASGSTAQVSCGRGAAPARPCLSALLVGPRPGLGPMGALMLQQQACPGCKHCLPACAGWTCQPLLASMRGGLQAGQVKGALVPAWQQFTMMLGGRCSCQLCELCTHRSSMVLGGRRSCQLCVNYAPTAAAWCLGGDAAANYV